MAGGNYGPGGGNAATGHADEKKTSAVPDSKFAPPPQPQPQPQPQVGGAGAAAAGGRPPLAPISGNAGLPSAADRKVAVASAAPGVRGSAAGAAAAASGGVAPMEDIVRGDNGMQVFGARGGAAAAGAGTPPAGDGKHKGDAQSGAHSGAHSVMDDYKRVVEAREKKMMEERAREDERKRADEKALACVRRTLRPFYQYQWLDVKDTENNWLEANVVAIEDKDGEPCIHIHYKGWKDKYDEWLPMRQCNDETSTLSQRLAPYLSKFRPETQRHGNVLPREGLQVDLLDTTEKWLSGEIVEVRMFPDGPMLKVRYTGWDPKYDEWITAESYRIAPLRTFTRALPPPVRHNSRYTAEQIEAMRATLDNETKFRLLLEAKMQCTIVVQAGDGNCCFRSVSHQVYGTADYHFLVRQRCMEYMRSEQSFYSQYVEGDFHMYIERMKLDGEWGDQIELQAMSEIYQRPVRVFAYSTDPYWEYKGLYQNNQPILVSYHFQSHYNSIQPLNPEVFAKPQLTTPPGEWEDLQLQRSRARGGRLARPGDNKEAGSGASPAAREAEQLQRALELSRNEFNNRDASQWEAGAAGRLQNFSSHADRMLDDAKKLSEQEFTQKQLMDAAMQRSEEELLAKVKAASLASQPVDQDPAVRAALEASMADAKAAGRVPQDDLARAIAASLAAQPGGAAAAAAGAADDLARVMELSRRDHERQQAAADDDLKAALAASAADPNARRAVAASAAANADTVVAACLEMGFSVEEAKAAYEVMFLPDVSKEILQQNVIGYLLSRRA